MKLIVPTALVLAATTPTTVQSWSMGGPSYFTSPMILQSPRSMRRRRALADRMFEETGRMIQQQRQECQKRQQLISPRYEITDTDEKFELSVDVPGVGPEDIDISLEDGYLTVRGQRTASNDSSRFQSKFAQSFSLDPAVDIDQFQANLNNGVLVVTAPKDMRKLEENIRKIPINTNFAATPSVVDEDMKKPSETEASVADALDKAEDNSPVAEHKDEASSPPKDEKKPAASDTEEDNDETAAASA